MHAFLSDLRQQLTDVSHSSFDYSDGSTSETAKFSQPPQGQGNSFFNFSSWGSFEQQSPKETRSRSKTKTKSPMQGSSGTKTRRNWTWDDSKENNQSSFTWCDGFEKPSDRKDNVLQVLSENNALCSPNQVPPACEMSKEWKIYNRDPSPFALIEFDDNARKSRDSLDEILDLAVEKRESEELCDLDIYRNEIFSFSTFTMEPPRNQKQNINEVIQVNKSSMDFGIHFPGKIFEEDLEIMNVTKQSIVLELFVNCLNAELQNSEEYVYSVRSNNCYDFSERRVLTLEAESRVNLKVALKVPGIKLKNPLQGQIKIISESFLDEFTIDLSSNVLIPRVFCPKQLFSQTLKRNIINMAVMKGKSQNLKLPLRNDSDSPITLDLGFYKSTAVGNDDSLFEVSISPKVLTIPPKSNANTTISIKQSKYLMGSQKNSEIKILYGKTQDSSLTYSFVMKIETF